MRYCNQHSFLRFSLLTVILSQIISANNASARSHIILDDRAVEIKSGIYNSSQFSGEGPGAVSIDYISEDSIVCPLFKSCGCSEYAIDQTPAEFRIDIYSILGFIWATDCCLEDQPPFDKGSADMVFTIKKDINGISGSVRIINKVDHYFISLEPEIEAIINNPMSADIMDEPFYRWLLFYINTYKSMGATNAQLYDLIVAFENEVENRHFLDERESEFLQIEFKQVCDLYKFALTHEGRQLDINELKILGRICDDIIAYYSKELPQP